MVVPLPGSNTFAPLADDHDSASSSRPATSMVPRLVPEEKRVTWTEVMADLSAKRTVDTACGMDAGIEEKWTFADHHATASSRDPPAYTCKRFIGSRPEVGKPDLLKLMQTLLDFSSRWKDADTVYLFVDNRDMESNERPPYWKFFCAMDT